MRHARRLERDRRFADWKRERRGATLVIVAICCVVILGFAGVGVDFARAYAFRTQVKTVADAAAMAGAVQMLKPGGTAAGAPDTAAVNYAPRNRVEGGATALVTDADVEAVEWDFNSRTVVEPSLGNDYTHPRANAIRVTARYNVATTFGRALNILQIPLRERTVAAIGGVGSQDCLKPFAVSYQTIIDLLNSRYPLATPRTVDDALSQTDINHLKADTSQTVTLLNSSQNQVTSGNIGEVKTWSDGWDPTDVNGGPYQEAITTSQCPNLVVGPGTWLESVPSAGVGATAKALKEYCDSHGGTSGNQNKFTCTKNPRVKLAMWDQHNGLNGDNLKYRVKIVGVFAITAFTKGNGQDTPDQVKGFFVDTPSTGTFTGAPGMTTKPAIVL